MDLSHKNSLRSMKSLGNGLHSHPSLFYGVDDKRPGMEAGGDAAKRKDEMVMDFIRPVMICLRIPGLMSAHDARAPRSKWTRLSQVSSWGVPHLG